MSAYRLACEKCLRPILLEPVGVDPAMTHFEGHCGCGAMALLSFCPGVATLTGLARAIGDEITAGAIRDIAKASGDAP